MAFQCLFTPFSHPRSSLLPAPDPGGGGGGVPLLPGPPGLPEGGGGPRPGQDRGPGHRGRGGPRGVLTHPAG